MSRTIRGYGSGWTTLRSVFAIGCVLLAALPSVAQEKPFDFYGRGPYRADIARPSTLLGYEAGTWHSTFRDQERVLFAIANAAPDKVKIIEFGKSVEGRPLRIFVVSSPENIAKVEEIRARIGKLADPRKLSEADAKAIIKDTPNLTWINETIHGDETASFESGMWLLYTLVASESPEITDALKKSVVIINPVFNPDGHERYVVYYNSIAVGSPEDISYEHSVPWAVWGRFNHYRFDMNRDKLAQSQAETRQETKEFLRWNPQVFVDQHGQPENYFFPPTSQPSNRNVDRERVEKWTDIFGRSNGAAFDKYGWQYVTRETFDFYAPFYLDSFSTLAGSIGMTYETDGGGNLARRRNDNTVSTLRDATAHHLETALATIVTSANHREELLKDFLAYKRAACTPNPKEKLQRVVIEPGDPGRLAEFGALLTRCGIEVKEITAPLKSTLATSYYTPGAKATPHTFPVGSLVIDLAQPQGSMARAFLEPEADMEPEFVKEQLARRERNEKRGTSERKEEYGFYDTTAWSLPFVYGLNAYATTDTPPVTGNLLELQGNLVPIMGNTGGIVGSAQGAVTYLFRFDRDNAAVMALRLLQSDYKLSVATKPLRAGGKEWPQGTFLARVSRNPESLTAEIDALGKTLGVPVYPVTTSYSDASNSGLNSEAVVSLKRPRIAVVEDDNVSITGFGSVWYALDQAGVKFTSVRLKKLSGPDLTRFNVILLPDGSGYFGKITKEGAQSLSDWVAEGNALIGLGGGGEWFTEKDANLTDSKIVGEEDEENADAAVDEKEPKKPKKPISIPGSLFAANINPTHFLGYGYPSGHITVPLDGSTMLKKSKSGANVVSFGKGPSRLSGFVWPDNTEILLADTAYVVDEPIGEGHALLYLSDPTSRALFPGLRRLFLSGILFGNTESQELNKYE